MMAMFSGESVREGILSVQINISIMVTAEVCLYASSSSSRLCYKCILSIFERMDHASDSYRAADGSYLVV